MTKQTDKADVEIAGLHGPLRSTAETMVDKWIKAHGLVIARWMTTQAQRYLYRISADEHLERKIGSYSDPQRSKPTGKPEVHHD